MNQRLLRRNCGVVCEIGNSADSSFVLDPYIADFFCHETGLVVEIDGGTHERTEAYDATRTVILNHTGNRVIRFLHEDVHDHLDRVLEAILEECESRLRP